MFDFLRYQKRIRHFKYLFKKSFNFIYFFTGYLAPSKDSFKIRKSCKLGQKKDEIKLIKDRTIFPFVRQYGCWEPEIIKFLSLYLNRTRYYNFIDIGANQGLMTRQIALEFNNVQKVFCFEPNSDFFDLLKLNLDKINPKALFNYALSNKDSYSNLIIGKENASATFHNDLIYGETRELSTELVEIKCVSRLFTNDFFGLPNNNFIVKIDTDGDDLLIIRELFNSQIWNRIDYLVFEYIVRSNPTSKSELNLLLDVCSQFEIVQLFDEKNTELDFPNDLYQINTQFNIGLAKKISRANK